MPDTECYRPVPAIPVAPQVHDARPLADRAGEIERVRATVATLRNERLIEQPARADRYSDRDAERREAVALTGRVARAQPAVDAQHDAALVERRNHRRALRFLRAPGRALTHGYALAHVRPTRSGRPS